MIGLIPRGLILQDQTREGNILLHYWVVFACSLGVGVITRIHGLKLSRKRCNHVLTSSSVTLITIDVYPET